MNTKTCTILLSLSLWTISSYGAIYSASAVAMEDMPMPAGKVEATKAVNGKGTVVSINKNGSSVVLKHEPIPAIQWSAMTMSFKVKDKMQLDKLKKGDKVDFTLVPDGKEYKIDSIK